MNKPIDFAFLGAIILIIGVIFQIQILAVPALVLIIGGLFGEFQESRREEKVEKSE